MNQQESFMIYKRNLYTGKLFKEPIKKESVNSKMSFPDFYQDYRDERTSFVVDWEVQEVEMQKFDDHSNPDSDPDISQRNVEFARSGRDSLAEKIASFIPFW